MQPDILWKEIITDLFEEFVGFFLPDFFDEVDFSKEYTFLEKELAELHIDSQYGKKYPDKLVKVYLKNGEEKYILIMIELQGYYDKDFSKRMFQYYYRIFDKYDKDIISIAIFTDENKNYKPDKFEKIFFNTKIVYEYITYKVLEQNENDLVRTENIFGLVILCALRKINSQNDDNKKYDFRRELIRLLLSKNYSKKEINRIFIFITGLLTLSEELERLFVKEEVPKLLGGKEKMPLTLEMTHFGQVLLREEYEKGIEKGELVGKIELIQEINNIDIYKEEELINKELDELKDILDNLKKDSIREKNKK